MREAEKQQKWNLAITRLFGTHYCRFLLFVGYYQSRTQELLVALMQY